MTKTAAAQLQIRVNRIKNFLGFARAYLKKNNLIKIFMTQIITTFKDLVTVKTKLKKIQYRINYERYKLKKTELILAQNSEHLFLKGRQLNQTR